MCDVRCFALRRVLLRCVMWCVALCCGVCGVLHFVALRWVGRDVCCVLRSMLCCVLCCVLRCVVLCVVCCVCCVVLCCVALLCVVLRVRCVVCVRGGRLSCWLLLKLPVVWSEVSHALSTHFAQCASTCIFQGLASLYYSLSIGVFSLVAGRLLNAVSLITFSEEVQLESHHLVFDITFYCHWWSF